MLLFLQGRKHGQTSIFEAHTPPPLPELNRCENEV